ncbi:hypothetical protein RIR_jg23003.t1 [Rhizophagus irregularis DAOM 181602=DAOM 197198]|nr:hypothetical protein RIR_jg23003.t1 [Rhizophagus irregularis DAOM 181602=DAOM 197198]
MGTFLWFYFGLNEPSAYSILGKRNGLLAYLTVEKKGTFDALDLEFGNVLSTYSILEETEWFKNIRYTIESVPNSNFETRILEIVGNRQNNWIDQSMSVFNNTSIA